MDGIEFRRGRSICVVRLLIATGAIKGKTRCRVFGTGKMHTLNPQCALVLFSGGQDSSIALGWALDRFDVVETIGFDYGQRHAVELGARMSLRREIMQHFPKWSEKLGQDTLVDLSALGRFGPTAMTSNAPIDIAENGLPTTFVPGRNLIFFSTAAGLAYQKKLGALVGGMCEVDYSGYPDCRAETLRAMEETLRLGLDTPISIETPLLTVSKADSWALAEKIGGDKFVDVVRTQSHTCYQGVRSELHSWGYGCGRCPACELRIKGWDEYQAQRRQRIA